MPSSRILTGMLGVAVLTLIFYTSYIEALAVTENFCDGVTTHNIITTSCINCWQNRRTGCPRGSKKLTRNAGKRGCVYQMQVGDRTQTARGCSHLCRETATSVQCCSGYWGSQCLDCPKDSSGLVCGGRGTCSDGVSGNGTCICNDHLNGSICEMCTKPQFYGPNCMSVCACGHGTCDNGINGTGACSCEDGYGGRDCNSELQACSMLKCHQNASCQSVGNNVGCVCNRGYTGDGTNCTGINPCLSAISSCGENATCVYTGPGRSSCSCKDGYRGDGYWCQAIDPCQTNSGGCNTTSSDCIFDGPAMSHCKCKDGFVEQAGSVCQLKDVCGVYPSTTCGENAQCSTVLLDGQITVNCMCPEGLLALDHHCYDQIHYEILRLNSSGQFSNQLNIVANSMPPYPFLYDDHEWTVFVPIDSAFPPDLLPLSNSPELKTIWRAHLVPGSIYVTFDQSSAKTMYPILGHDYPIRLLNPGVIPDSDPDDDDDGYFADLKFKEKSIGKVLSGPNPASNGMIYIIDQLLIDKDMDSLVSESGTIETLKRFDELSNFTNLLTKSSSFVMKLTIAPAYSLFAPTNDAMSVLGEEEMSYLLSPKGLFTLETLLAYNLALRRIVNSAYELATSDFLLTTEGINVNVSKEDGAITLGSEKAKVLVTDISINGGNILIYIIDKVIIPYSIKPLIKNICPKSVTKQIRGPCGDCNSKLCKSGGRPLAEDISQSQTCTYQAKVTIGDGPPRYLSKMGCSILCRHTVVVDECCEGFYGLQCRSCMGPAHSACNDNGVCNDLKSGNGQCSCNEGFSGPACDKCSNATKFGPNCDTDCPCLNGVCLNTTSSRGECFPGTCKDGWGGENCDREIVNCSDGALSCHQFASCVVSDDGNSSCVCDPGYTGSGENCFAFNPCSDPTTNPCSINAYCSNAGGGGTICTCFPNFSGDGRRCKPVDNCMLKDRGGCSANADCIATGPGKSYCRCLQGYRGGGDVCTEINVCEENNGGCGPRASCTSTGPGTRSCTCFDGYKQVEEDCLGSILQEIASVSELSQIHSWIQRWRSVKSFFMNIENGYTCFFPMNSAWTDMSDEDSDFWLTEQHLLFVLKNHITQTFLPTTKLIELKGQPVTSLLDSVSIDITDVTVGADDVNVAQNVTERSNLPTLGKRLHAKLMMWDLPVYGDGIVHIIDAVMIPPRDAVMDYKPLSSMIADLTGTGFQNYSNFISYLNTSGIISTIEDSDQPYTLFLASNTAMKISNDSSSDAIIRAKYHVILGTLFRGVDIASGEHVSTLAGSGYMVTLVRRHESLIVNRKYVLDIANRTDKGIVYRLVDEMLQPQKTRCDFSYSTQATTRCLPCYFPSSCPSTSKLVQKKYCLFAHIASGGEHKTSTGCQNVCTFDNSGPKCCGGFYGDGCDPCPGGLNNVCFGRGNCSDGMKGNGTCTCSDPKYTGVACETCAKGRYGRNCDSLCKCVHGTCNDGVEGDGTCACALGFRGVYCDQVVNDANSCGNTCDTKANCVPAKLGTGNECICSAGYSGDGTDCQAINPCKNGRADCHQNADCGYISPGNHNCTCHKKYEGDGYQCSPVNPCLKSYGEKCDPNANCYMTAPNASKCVCKTYFTGDGKSCTEIDPCEKDNGGCSENAICKKGDVPGERSCKCIENYLGDGITCTGSIYSYISGLPKFVWFTLMDTFASLLPHIMERGDRLAVFLPSQSIIMKLNSSWLNYEEPATQLYLNHIVGCFDKQNLSGVTVMRTLAGNILNITQNSSGTYIDNKITVLGDPRQFWNGILYEIDLPLVPKSLERVLNKKSEKTKLVKILEPLLENASDTSAPLYKNTKVFLDHGFQWFVTLLETSGELETLQYPLHNPWTFLLPTEAAFRLQTAQRLRSFMNQDDPTYASEYGRYHMIREAFIDPVSASALSKSDLRTMQGSIISFQCDSKSGIQGQIVVNDGEARVIGFDVFHIKTQTGQEEKSAVYIIDKVLAPPSIGGRCDSEVYSEETSPCTLCLASRPKCMGNKTLVSQHQCPLAISTSGLGTTVHVQGCAITCSGYTKKHQCCPNFFGPFCQACPGGAGSPCSGNGKCNDGVNGTGECKCKTGFVGIACENCDTGRYGRNCQKCQCSLYGHCNEGVDGDGTCFCDSAWDGPQCTLKRTDNNICKPECHKNGYCLDSGSCYCKPGFSGDGVTECEFLDMCQVDNGGCSPFADCEISQDQVKCRCKKNYVGDGYNCVPHDPCTTLSTTCHASAYCSVDSSADSAQCVCKPGYVGDGIKSCRKQEARTCRTNNGGCSLQAICTDIPPKSVGSLPTTNCTCQPSYIGDGFTCHGTVMDVIKQSPEMRNFYSQLRKQPFRYRRRMNDISVNYTVFVPAQVSTTKKPLYVIKRHIVQGSILPYSTLKTMKSVLVNSNDELPVQIVGDDVHVNGVRVRRSDILATNGVLHVVDAFLPPANPGSTTSPRSPITKNIPKSRKTPSPNQTHPLIPIVTAKPKGPAVKTVTPTPNKPIRTPKNPTMAPNSSNPSISVGPTVSAGSTNVGVASKSSSNPAAVAVPVVLVLLLIIAGVVGVFWWKKRNSGGFSLFNDRVGYDSAEAEPFSGLSNPAYDSTGFNTTDNDDVVMSNTDEDTALAMKGDEGPISFEKPKRS